LDCTGALWPERSRHWAEPNQHREHRTQGWNGWIK